MRGHYLSTIKRIQKLAHEQCANFTEPNRCLLELDNELTCRFFRECRKPDDIRCRYFEESVLPAEPLLESRYWGSSASIQSDNCVRCKCPFVRKSNRQKYCTTCRDEVRRGQVREAVRAVRGEKWTR
ncbi:cysteine-rich VLP protein [Paenibacillus sp. S-12]|uniref:cysteine-rich VLP protein n=1 Tax=Paenibacillus sp. S-12 TaxID=3031371 RepID=UPI00338E42BE